MSHVGFVSTLQERVPSHAALKNTSRYRQPFDLTRWLPAPGLNLLVQIRSLNIRLGEEPRR
jgi:hypothetical protein